MKDLKKYFEKHPVYEVKEVVEEDGFNSIRVESSQEQKAVDIEFSDFGSYKIITTDAKENYEVVDECEVYSERELKRKVSNILLFPNN